MITVIGWRSKYWKWRTRSREISPHKPRIVMMPTLLPWQALVPPISNVGVIMTTLGFQHTSHLEMSHSWYCLPICIGGTALEEPVMWLRHRFNFEGAVLWHRHASLELKRFAIQEPVNPEEKLAWYISASLITWLHYGMEMLSALMENFVRGIHLSPVDLTKGQWYGGLMMSFMLTSPKLFDTETSCRWF